MLHLQAINCSPYLMWKEVRPVGAVYNPSGQNDWSNHPAIYKNPPFSIGRLATKGGVPSVPDTRHFWETVAGSPDFNQHMGEGLSQPKLWDFQLNTKPGIAYAHDWQPFYVIGVTSIHLCSFTHVPAEVVISFWKNYRISCCIHKETSWICLAYLVPVCQHQFGDQCLEYQDDDIYPL